MSVRSIALHAPGKGRLRPFPLAGLISLAAHVLLIGALVLAESRHWERWRRPRPEIPVELVAEPAVPPIEEAPEAVAPTRPEPAPAEERPVEKRPAEPPRPQIRLESTPPPADVPSPGGPPSGTPPPASPPPGPGVSSWWSPRMSAVTLVGGWRAGDVAADTTWLAPVPAEIAARDSSLRRMNEDFLDRIPGILYEEFKKKLLEDFPLMR